MYVYEYTDDAVPTKCPRQCLPYALMEFSNCATSRNDSCTHAANQKSISSSAANAGWTSIRRPRPFANEPLSFVHPPVQHIPPITPPLTPSDADSLCSSQGKEMFSPEKGSSCVRDPECSAWRAPEERRDNVSMERSNMPDRPITQPVIDLPSRPRSPDLKEPRIWPASSENGFESSSDNRPADIGQCPPSLVATASRDPMVTQISGDASVWQLEVGGLEQVFKGGYGEHQGSSCAPTQNVLATVKKLWGHTSSTPAGHAALHPQVEPDPMDSWGLTWNGNDDESEQNQNVYSSRAQRFHHENQHLTPAANQRHIKDQTSGQERTFNQSLFERSFSEPSTLLSERDLASLCDSGDSLSMKRTTPLALLNCMPIKSALKKPVLTPLPSSEAEGKKKKTLTFQDYLRKKKAETITDIKEKLEMNLPVTAVNNDRAEAVASLPDEPTDKGTCPSTMSVCASHSPNAVLEAESESSMHSSNIGTCSPSLMCSSRVEVQTTADHGQTSAADIVGSSKSVPACNSVPLPAVHQFAVNFQKAKDPRLQSMLKTLNTSPCRSSQGDGAGGRSDATGGGDATVANSDIGAVENQKSHRSPILDQLARMYPESQAGLENVAHAKQLLHPADNSNVAEAKALKNAPFESCKTVGGEEKDIVELQSLSKSAETANHQVLFSDIPDDRDNENVLCMSLDESHSQEDSSEVGETETTRAADRGELKAASGMEETKGAESKRQEMTKLKVSSLSMTKPSTETSNTSKETGKQDDSAPKSFLSPCMLAADLMTFSGEPNEDMTQLLRIAKGLRGKPPQSAAEDARKSWNVSPSSDTSSRKSRNVSPCSDSSAYTSIRSFARSSKESTSDRLKNRLLQFSSAANTETDELDNMSIPQQRQPAEAFVAAGVKRKKAKGKLKQYGNTVDIGALEPQVDPYALLRLSKGLRPGKSILVGGLGKNPTDDPLPLLGDNRRKRTMVKCCTESWLFFFFQLRSWVALLF